ncbi:MAG: hypothetical protein E7387_00280 [Ruminococcaceae bacterium]|nr:hypothetical protein [Oscillospiraceae bacterium]
MKRISAILLALIICVTSLTFTVSAEDPGFLYTDADIEELYYDYENIQAMVETMFFKKDGLAYWTYVDSMAERKTASKFISIANKVIGETPDKKYYAQVLTNMIAVIECDLAQQIETQGQYDNMKNVKEYAFDVFDIAATVAGIDGTAEKIADGLKLASTGIELAVNTTNELKYYELCVRNYMNAETFLKAIYDNTDNADMKEAAGELRSANQLLYKERMNFVSSASEEIAVFSVDNFLGKLGFGLLKKVDAYKTDTVVKDYVDYGEKAFKSLDSLVSTGKAVFKTVMMGGDILFGTTNTFRRHNEMVAMTDIAEALIAANNKITVSKSDSAQATYSNIRAKAELYKMLIATHLRGEYLIYSLNQEDAGVLSVISKMLDGFKNEEDTIKKWYNTQTDYCEEYYNMINNIFVRLMKQKYVVHNGFELHDGFIVEVEKKTEVPEGYSGIYSYEDFKKITDSCPRETTLLTSIRVHANEINTAKYILMNDITFPAEYDIPAVFYGVLDGNGYTMKNMSKQLFGYIGNATIKNLGMEINHTADTEDKESAGGAISNSTMGWNNKNGCIIDNCFVKGSIDITARSGDFGGLMGNADGATITNCYNEADINIKTRQSGALGGIAGEDGKISNCYNTGNLKMYASCENTFNVYSITVYVGGIKGYNYADTIENCYNTGNISAQSGLGCSVSSGGILGYNYGSVSNSYIKNCYNLGNVTNDWAEDYDTTEDYGGVLQPYYCSGGIVGLSGYNLHIQKCWNSGNISGEMYMGGIIGRSTLDDNDEISDCFNLGSVTGVQFAGGIVGKDFSKTPIINCYNTGTVSGATSSGSIAGEIQNAEDSIKGCYYLDNGTPATATGTKYSGANAVSSEQMKDKSTFAEFDFINTWRLREEDVMPLLKQ